ncbi:MAG: DNA-J related domain-containing protein [Thalassolituus sp.]|uniref:DNA-J related domain-containing protein n=1 Tax=Thalassolituus sp. TaxID=2030822 RepID=UPI0039829398
MTSLISASGPLFNLSPAEALDSEPMLDLLACCLADGSSRSEYDIIRWLQQPEQSVFRKDAMSDNLTLFQTHFMLMHWLYQLRERLINAKAGILNISALSIVLEPWPQADNAEKRSGEPSANTPLTSADPLAAYYLDINNLSTDRQGVENLLSSFWLLMLEPGHRDQDLALLELSEPVSNQEVRLQYRRLAMQHHPDRGGDDASFREITAAYQRLKLQF